MSELKAYRVKGVTLGDIHDVYLKSEADKVIAEKDKQINELRTEVARLKARIAELENENAELKEAQRWRKFSDEKPQDGQEVWAYDSSQKLVIKLEYQVRENCEGFVGFPIIHGFWPCITYWMPYNKPKAPEEK